MNGALPRKVLHACQTGTNSFTTLGCTPDGEHKGLFQQGCCTFVFANIRPFSGMMFFLLWPSHPPQIVLSLSCDKRLQLGRKEDHVLKGMQCICKKCVKFVCFLGCVAEHNKRCASVFIRAAALTDCKLWMRLETIAISLSWSITIICKNKRKRKSCVVGMLSLSLASNCDCIL